MRQRAPFVHYIVLALALVFVAATPTRAGADDRAEARTHYQAGVKFYNGGDYKAAIREFSAAQQLVPADLNNYNLALCYDKLGDAEPAVQYYRAYLDKIPNTDKRTEIEASIARLDAAAKSAAAKRAEEARKADEAKKAAEAKRAAEEAKAMEAAAKSEEEARKAEEARRASEAKRPPVDGSAIVEKPPVETAGAGSSGTPGTGIVSTGDAQLDRVQAIDINAIRDQRLGGAGSGMVDRRGGPATVPAGGAGAASTGAGAGTPPPPPSNTASAQGPKSVPLDQHDQKKADPIYKKWWFWAVVAVSAYVVYSIASDSSSSSGTAVREVLPLGPVSTANQAGGYTLLRW